jgi:hypothetical protein
LIGKRSIKEIAKLECIQYNTVRKLVLETRANPNYLSKLRNEEQERDQALSSVETVVKKTLKAGKPILKVDEVWRQVEKQNPDVIGRNRVRLYMKKTLGLKFRKVRRQPLWTNSERCLVQRQQYAYRMLDVLDKYKRVINVDESWISETNY